MTGARIAHLTDTKVALITGAAQRIGAVIARGLHGAGMNLILHYRSSRAAAQALQEELQAERPESVLLVQSDLLSLAGLPPLVKQAAEAWGRLDVLVNNASTFYRTPVGRITEADWDDLFGTNAKAPLFLAQAAAPYLRAQRGCIVNIADIHGERPLKDYPVYSMAKAALLMLTRALASDLGPEVRVNAVAPGAILWPQREIDDVTKQRIISRTFLKRTGCPEDVAKAVLFLVRDADYMSGQVLTLDGGRMLNN